MAGTLPRVIQTGKSLVTPRNILFGNVAEMSRYVHSDEIREGWRSAERPDQRLKWARLHWQSQSDAIGATAEDAAISLGMKPGTYRAFEREPGSSKTIALGTQEAIRFARKFGVSWVWLLAGQGTPFDEDMPEPQERILKAVKSLDDDEQIALANMIETLVAKRRAS